MAERPIKATQSQPKALTVTFGEDYSVTTKEELLPEIRTLDVNLSDVGYIQKDINMIVLPFFWFCRKTNYNIINYYFDNDKTKKMEVTSATGDTIPTAFDYEIVQVLLKFRQAMRMKSKDKEEFICTVWDIAKELGILTKNRNGYFGLSKEKKDRIVKSIVRLQTTSYSLQNLYNIKSTSDDGVHSYSREEKVLIHILDNVRIKSDLFDTEATFNIKFNDLFLESIESKYHFSYELAKLKAITKTSAKRFFEIIDFRRHKRLVNSFKYKEIAGLIPLNSGRQNKVYINEYLKHLKEVGVIIDYQTNTPPNSFTVHFLKETKQRKDRLEAQYLHTELTPQITNIEPIPPRLSVEEVAKNDALLPLQLTPDHSFIESTLKEKSHEAYVADVTQIYDSSRQSQEVFTSNLIYALNNHRKDGSFLAYLKGAVADDWAKEVRIKKELENKKVEDLEILAQKIELKEQERTKQAEAEEEQYRVFMATLPTAEQNRIWEQAEDNLRPAFKALSKSARMRQSAHWEEIKTILDERRVVNEV